MTRIRLSDANQLEQHAMIGQPRQLAAGLLFCLCSFSPAKAAVDSFVETFRGTGPYDTTGGAFQGLDNPGWSIYGDGEVTPDGFAVSSSPEDGGISSNDRIQRFFTGKGSFTTRLELTDLRLPGGDNDFSISDFGWFYDLKPDANGGLNAIWVTITFDQINTEPGYWHFGAVVSDKGTGMEIPAADDIALEIQFEDSESPQVTFRYFDNLEDDTPEVEIGPVRFRSTLEDEEHLTYLSVGRFEGGVASAVISSWSLTPVSGILGDFDGDEQLDVDDIDALSSVVRAGTNDAAYDLNDDQLVDELDRITWVKTLKGTYFGDADLNGLFDSTDLVQVLGFGEYEDDTQLNSTWLTGDWDGDGDFTSGDLVTALADGGYELGIQNVPEPSGFLIALLFPPSLICAVRQRI